MPTVGILSYFSKDLPQGMSLVAPFSPFNISKDLPQVTVTAPHSSLVIRGLCPYSLPPSAQTRGEIPPATEPNLCIASASIGAVCGNA